MDTGSFMHWATNELYFIRCMQGDMFFDYVRLTICATTALYSTHFGQSQYVKMGVSPVTLALHTF